MVLSELQQLVVGQLALQKLVSQQTPLELKCFHRQGETGTVATVAPHWDHPGKQPSSQERWPCPQS